MATQLADGCVPALYREFYDLVCLDGNDRIDREMFIRLLEKYSGLTRQTLSQICDTVDNKQNYLTRSNLYKALALTALAQQGKTVSMKILQTFSDQELPKPSIGEMSDLRALHSTICKERASNSFNFTYQELCELDTIQVNLVSEKKGLIMKHVVYEVSSKRYRACVERRYRDFVAFLDLLLMRFPYRVLPRLPPKKVMHMLDKDFMEQRRSALQRFLTIVARHPTFLNDRVLEFFFTFKGTDMENKIREHFRALPDEFMTSSVALKSKDISTDMQSQFSRNREFIAKITDSVIKIRDMCERLVLSANNFASDLQIVSSELSTLSTVDSSGISDWSGNQNCGWNRLTKDFKSLVPEYSSLGETARKQASGLNSQALDVISMLVDQLVAYKDLCIRHEKGVLSDHQRMMQKFNQYKKRPGSISNEPEAASIAEMEQRILKQEVELSNMESRNNFSLHCIKMETQLIYANLEALQQTLHAMAEEERKACFERGGLWAQISPLLQSFLSQQNSKE